MIFIENLSPLIGCKLNSKRWSPYTGYNVCKALEIASIICTNVDGDTYKKGHINYVFSNRITVKASKIYELCKKYSPTVLDTSYFIAERGGIAPQVSLVDLIFIYTHSSGFNDSAIFDIFENQKDLKYCGLHKQVMLILLQSFAIRWVLYEHFIEKKALDRSETDDSVFIRLIENIRYVKAKLEEYDSDKTAELCHHLATLMLNLSTLKYELEEYTGDRV